jgi:hypothetical protein
MKLFRILTTCSFLRRLFVAAAALLVSIGAAKAAGTNYSATILADNPVAYYELQELPGATIAVDSSSNGLNGAYNFNDANSPELGQPGIDTNSILFTYGPGGETDYGDVSLPASLLLAPVNSDGLSGAPFSAECWVEATTLATPDYIVPLAMSGAYGGPNPDGSGWNFYQSQTSPQSWQVFMRTTNAVDIVGSGANVVLGQWTHLAVTWDGTTATFYVNGQPNASSPLPGYLADPNGGDGVIGGPGQTGHGPFEGGVTQVAFYTNVLTAAQILNHYNVGTNNISAPPAPPSFVNEPALPTTIYSGTPVTLTALVAGSAPLTYQWFQNNTPITGQTNNSYSFVPVYPADNNASYYLNVTNNIGSTNSTTNVLTLLTNLNLIAPPFSITRNVGSHAAFRIAANGALPIGYQWFESANGSTFTTLTNQTSDTLWLTNVQMNLSGNEYWVVVTNPFTSYSNFATLSVQARAVTVPLTGYGAIVAADNPVAFYRLNEPTNSTTATDAVGSFDGAYNNTLGPIDWQIATGIPGDTNLGVGLFDTNALPGNGGMVDIPYALELNPYGTWSFEGWFEPTLQDGNYRTVCSSMYNSNYSTALFGWLIYQHPASAFTLVTYNGTGAPATFISDFANIPLKIGSWYHLALVNDGTTVQLYVNGVAGSANGPSSLFLPNGINGDSSLGAANSVLAQRSDLAFSGFNGGVDEVAFYNYPLSPSQIMAHYLGKASLSFSQVNGKIILTWPLGTLRGSTNVAGPYLAITGATSPYTVPITYSQFFYVVSVP